MSWRRKIRSKKSLIRSQIQISARKKIDHSPDQVEERIVGGEGHAYGIPPCGARASLRERSSGWGRTGTYGLRAVPRADGDHSVVTGVPVASLRLAQSGVRVVCRRRVEHVSRHRQGQPQARLLECLAEVGHALHMLVTVT